MQFSDIIRKLSAVFGFEPDHEGDSCQFVIGEIPVLLEEAGDKMLLVADLGDTELPEDKVFAMFLSANYVYRETSGSSFARDPETGHIMLQRYDWMDRLDGEMLVNYLERFADVALKWRDILAGGVPGEESGSEAAPMDRSFMENLNLMA